MSIETPKIEQRDDRLWVEAMRQRLRSYLENWRPGERGADAAILWIVARYLETITKRLNLAPDKNLLAFLEMAGIRRISPQSARAPMVFKLGNLAGDGSIPESTRLAAPPAPDRAEQLNFETERRIGLAAAQIKEIACLHPGRDEFASYFAAFQQEQPFQLFAQMQRTEHSLYLAHERLLQLAGNAILKVDFDLSITSSQRLRQIWEYWDGEFWRPFENVLEQCGSGSITEDLDGTDGLTRSGTVTLKSDCAETKQRDINGIESFWIRSRLLDSLPADPTQILPSADTVKLRTELSDLLAISGEVSNSQVGVIDADEDADEDEADVLGEVRDQDGLPLQGVLVFITLDNVDQPPVKTNSLGKYELRFDHVEFPQPSVTVTLTMGSVILLGDEVEITAGEQFLRVDFLVRVQAPAAFDKAFTDGEKVDLDKTFFPFGQQPQPGNAFYLTSDAIFSKPDALIQIFMQRVSSPQDENKVQALSGNGGDADQSEPLDHTVVWEYWNGRRWAPLPLLSPEVVPEGQSVQQAPSSAGQPKGDLDTTEVVTIRAPKDFERRKINDEDGYWIRVRLVGGGFGFRQRVTWRDQAQNINEFTYVINQPPVLSTLGFGFFWQSPPEFLDHVVTLNDFSYSDQTEAAKAPGISFSPFTRLADQTPATYLGFDKKLPVDLISLFFNIEEERDADPAPALTWEYWNGAAWRLLAVEDETGNLSRPGMLSFIGPDDAQSLARFGVPWYWIRGRRREDGTPYPSQVRGVFVNSVWASQRQTQRNEPLGASNGLVNQVFSLRQTPVLEGEVIEVRELFGKIAEIEYPLLKASLDSRDLRVVRDPQNRVSEVWVRWHAQPHFHFSGHEDRHYVIERVGGRIFFGDGDHGRIPPTGALILAGQYRFGGGLAGNVAQRAISQLVGGVPGVQEVFNALPAEGGADAEAAGRIRWRGPQTLRHRGRALLVEDYEVMAFEASPAVSWVRVFATRDKNQVRRPGYVKVMILPDSSERRPWPSFGLRERVRRYLQERGPSTLAGDSYIWVTGPSFFPVGVETMIVPVDASQAGVVEQSVRAVLEEFLHPLRGGPGGRGWELGRDVYLSDVAAKIERVEGVDFVEEVMLTRASIPQGERVSVPDDQLVAAGDIRIKLRLQ